VPGPVLHDTVSLLHFAVVARLDILEARHATLPEPRWADAVYREVEVGAAHGKAGCRELLGTSWLGTPFAPSGKDQRKVLLLLLGLNEGRRPPTSHAGEAESILFAEKLTGTLVTDDSAAYDFAMRRLGLGRVKDTISILRDAVAMDELAPIDALGVADAIRDSGRELRRSHPTTMSAKYFLQ
jgi:hypothetical protein